jgi:hypothetical protein
MDFFELAGGISIFKPRVIPHRIDQFFTHCSFTCQLAYKRCALRMQNQIRKKG